MYPEPVVLLITFFITALGAIIGSFLNVCIYRLPRGYVSIAYPPSHCPHCGTWLHWFDNIPILSWLTLAGACRYCRSPIRFRYVLVESLTAFLFFCCARFIVIDPVASFVSLNEQERWLALGISLYLVADLMVITFIDMDYRIIPDGLTYPGIIIAPIFSAIFPVFHNATSVITEPHLLGFLSSVLGIVVGGGSLYVVGVIGKIIFHKDAMGFGDVKMMAMVGGLLGWDAALLAFLLACVGGTVIGIGWMLITKDHYIPFGPYLAVGTVVVLFYHHETVHFIFTVWPQLISRLMGINFPPGY